MPEDERRVNPETKKSERRTWDAAAGTWKWIPEGGTGGGESDADISKRMLSSPPPSSSSEKEPESQAEIDKMTSPLAKAAAQRRRKQWDAEHQAKALKSGS